LLFLTIASGTSKKTALTVDEIRQRLKSARVKDRAKVNVADVLSKSGHLVDTSGLQGKRRLWSLTGSGREHVQPFERSRQKR
jgi:hypothetical protein